MFSSCFLSYKKYLFDPFYKRKLLLISRRALSRFQKSLYDILGLKPNCSQAQIKSAYYKLSKIYHPDRNIDRPDAVNRFREITEAYEVLGNVSLRRKYDSNLLDRSSEMYHDEEDYTKDFKFKKARGRKSPPTGKTKIYDFDEYYRMHYGQSIQKEAFNRARYQEKEAKEAAFKRQSQSDAAILTLLLLLFGLLVVGFIAASK